MDGTARTCGRFRQAAVQHASFADFLSDYYLSGKYVPPTLVKVGETFAERQAQAGPIIQRRNGPTYGWEVIGARVQRPGVLRAAVDNCASVWEFRIALL
jgi:hypothetical protein